MAKYFKFVGYLLLILSAAGVIIDIISIVQIAKTVSSSNWSPLFILIFILVISIIVGPALGLLFITHANTLERHEDEDLIDEAEIEMELNKPLKKEDNSKEDKSQKSSSEKYSAKITSTSISVNGNTYSIKYVENIKLKDKEVSFDFYSKHEKIVFSTKEEASKFYSTLEANINNLK